MDNMRETAPYAQGNQASMEAAESIQHKLKGIRANVFEYIVKQGSVGVTGSEIATALNILPYTAKPRCTELCDAGYIKNSGEVRKNKNNRNETVWVACDSWPNEPYEKKGDKQVKAVNRWCIWSNEHSGWWRPNRAGYTTEPTKAGVYTYQQAMNICREASYGSYRGIPNETMIDAETLEEFLI